MSKYLIPYLVAFSALLLPAQCRDFSGPGCPQTGPVIPPSVIDHAHLQSLLSERLSAEKLADIPGVNRDLTSFSLHINGGGKLLHAAHHTATKRNSSGVDKVDGDSYYRIASITKVFTYLATLLVDGMHPGDRVGKWIPELRVENGALGWWEGVTLQQLGSHTAGLPREDYIGDLAAMANDEMVEAGWPRVEPPKGEDCKEDDLACLRRNTLLLAARTEPANQPGVRPNYSNLGFTLLALALENATNKTYDNAVRDLIFEPLGMKDSTLDMPKVERGVISVNGSKGWDLELKVDKGAGAMFTTSHDMSLFLNNMENKLELFRKTPASYSSWLSPTSFLSSNYDVVGAPWEIFRLDEHTPDHRPITLYTKGGTLPAFVSEIQIIPEYGLSFSLFVSSDLTQQIEKLQDYITQAIIEETEKLARESARKLYGGLYTATALDTHGHRMEVEISQDSDKAAGLKVIKMVKGDKDILSALFKFAWSQQPKGKATARLYSSADNARDFRIVPIAEGYFPGEKEGPKYNGKALGCVGWFTAGMSYGGVGVDLVRFHFGTKGEVESLEIPSMKLFLRKQEPRQDVPSAEL